MDLLSTIILGIVEGITEFLPVSSTGHLILASELMKIPQTDFVKSFEIAIQLGAIFSAIFLYWRELFFDVEALKRVAVAFIPTGIAGLFLYDFFKQSLLGSSQIVVWSLLLGGLFFILFEKLHKKRGKSNEKISGIPFKKCLFIGIIQTISIIPGVSRAGATIAGGLLAGLRRETVVKFSFLLAIPTMLVATGYDLIKSPAVLSNSQIDLLVVGFITSFFVAILTVRFFLNFIKKSNFIPFGVYRIIIAVIWLLVFF